MYLKENLCIIGVLDQEILVLNTSTFYRKIKKWSQDRILVMASLFCKCLKN